jgi:hypothetical protein
LLSFFCAKQALGPKNQNEDEKHKADYLFIGEAQKIAGG